MHIQAYEDDRVVPVGFGKDLIGTLLAIKNGLDLDGNFAQELE